MRLKPVAASARLRRSRHISFFRKKDEIFVYHDLWGYVLQMDARVHEFVERFGPDEGRTVADVAREAKFRPEEVEGFVGTFRQHRCLVLPRADEREEAFAQGYPSKASWIVAWAPAGDEVVIAYKDRGLKRVVLERLSRLESRFFSLADGEKTAAEISERLEPEFAGLDVRAEVRRLLFRLTHSDRQVLKLTDRPLYEYLAFPPPYLRSTMPYPRIEEAGDAAESPDVVDLETFHRQEIEDAQAQFDVEETTLSHMFREPHEALLGKSYGEAFEEAVEARGLLPGAGTGTGTSTSGRSVEVVEVGGGVGFFALRFLRAVAERQPEVYAGLRYTILDLSQVLQDSQRMLNFELGGKVRYALANASRGLPLRDGSVDLLISNEVIADLETVRLHRGKVRETAALDTPAARRQRERPRVPPAAERAVREARALVNRWQIPIDDAPEVFWLNLGALKLVEELARVLKPGGAGVLVEFGGENRWPVESTHLGHGEFSIHFGHLRHVAQRLGLEVEICDVMTLVGLRGDVRVLATTRSYFECLRALLDRRGISLQKLAYTEAQLAALCAGRIDLKHLHGLQFRPVRDRALGLHPPEFLVAVIRKPR